MNKASIIQTQKQIGTAPDGFWGPKSIVACQKYLRSLMPKVNPWPTTSGLAAFFGRAGDESNLVNLPVEGVKYDGKPVKTIRCNAAVVESLGRIIKLLPQEILGDYNGCFNFRKMRGGSSYSLHAYGAAIDFCASTNGNHTHWPTKATMPLEVMEIFAKEGWLSAGAFWSRDAMHFQATR